MLGYPCTEWSARASASRHLWLASESDFRTFHVESSPASDRFGVGRVRQESSALARAGGTNPNLVLSRCPRLSGWATAHALLPRIANEQQPHVQGLGSFTEQRCRRLTGWTSLMNSNRGRVVPRFPAPSARIGQNLRGAQEPPLLDRRTFPLSAERAARPAGRGG